MGNGDGNNGGRSDNGVQLTDLNPPSLTLFFSLLPTLFSLLKASSTILSRRTSIC
jgi:hypothetical protein